MHRSSPLHLPLHGKGRAFDHGCLARWRRLWALTLVFGLGFFQLGAGEKIQYPAKAPKVEIKPGGQQEKKPDAFNENRSLSPVMDLPSGHTGPSTMHRDPDLQQKLDRQKNWIFPTNEKEEQTVNLNKMFGVKEYNEIGQERKPKTVMEEFLEGDHEGTPKRENSKPKWFEQGRYDAANSDSSASGFDFNPVQRHSSFSGTGIDAPKRINPFSVRDGFFAPADPKKNNKNATAPVFDTLFPGPGSGVPKLLANDPINSLVDTSRDPFTPVTGANPNVAPDPASKPNPYLSTSITGPLKSANHPLMDDWAKKLNPPSLAGTTVETPLPPQVKFQPKPVKLELPARKF